MDEAARRVERQRAFDGVHPLDPRADGLAIRMPRPSSPSVPRRSAVSVHGRGVLLDHLGAVDEPAGGQHDTGAGADGDLLAVARRRRRRSTRPVVVDDQASRRVVSYSGRGAGVDRRRADSDCHQRGPAGPAALHDVGPRSGRGELVEGVGVLAAGEHQPFALDRRGAVAVGQVRCRGTATPRADSQSWCSRLSLAVQVDLGVVRRPGRRPPSRNVFMFSTESSKPACALRRACRRRGR